MLELTEVSIIAFLHGNERYRRHTFFLVSNNETEFSD